MLVGWAMGIGFMADLRQRASRVSSPVIRQPNSMGMQPARAAGSLEVVHTVGQARTWNRAFLESD